MWYIVWALFMAYGIYLYEEGVSIAGRCAYRLKKNGYTNIYILKHGFEAWNGKVKKREN